MPDVCVAMHGGMVCRSAYPTGWRCAPSASHMADMWAHVQVSASLTAQNSWTPLWAAPEVIRHERASIKADIWSFGILIWELVSLQNLADFPSLGMACQMKVRWPLPVSSQLASVPV